MLILLTIVCVLGNFYKVNWISKKCKDKIELLIALLFMFFWIIEK